MQRQSNPKSNDNSKVEPHLPKPNESSNNAADSRPRLVEKEAEQEVKMKVPLLPPLVPTTSIFKDQVETRKATVNLDKAIEYELKHGRKLDSKMDRKKLRRTVSNRLSAQRSRVKKAQYIHDMERRITELEDTIVVLTLRVKRFKEKRRQLQLQNEALERLVQIRLNEAHLAQMVLEKNKAELARLKEVEKGLLKELQMQAGGWSCGQQQSSSSFYEDEQLLQKQLAQVAMVNPFLNFEP